MTDTFNPSTSAVGSVTVNAAAIDTTTTMVLPTTGALFVNVAFPVTGMLTRNDTGVGIPNQTIQLQDGSGNNIDGATAVTAADGTYSMEMTEAAAGTYEFQSYFAGGSD